MLKCNILGKYIVQIVKFTNYKLIQSLDSKILTVELFINNDRLLIFT